jgi:uncharacterized protein YjbJ (UPF0337 family)
MNKNHVKGTAKDAEGKVRRTVGTATGDVSEQIKGAAQQVQGKAQKALGDAQDAVKPDPATPPNRRT